MNNKTPYSVKYRIKYDILKAVSIILCLFLPFSAQAVEPNKPQVKLETNFGDIILELNQEKAPKSVANFLDYVNRGYYDNTIFHRVIDGFMAQGGGFTPDYEKKATNPPVENEADNKLKNLNGTIAMARTSAPHSATSQFFINVADNAFLDYRSSTMRGWGYTVFGKVIQGMDVVDKIKKLPTGAAGPFRKDVPGSPVIIMKATQLSGMSAPAAPTMNVN